MNKKFFKKAISITLTITTIIWSFGLPLGILFTPSTAQALTSVAITNGTVNGNFPGAPVPASSPAIALVKLSVTASDAAEVLTAVTVNFSGTGFDTTDLETLATDATSGVALYDDLGDTAGTFVDASDSVVTLGSSPVFSSGTLTLTPATPVALADSGATVFYIVIKTSATAEDGDQITATVPATTGVVTSLGSAGPVTQTSLNMVMVDATGASISSVEGFAGQDTITVRFSGPVQTIAEGNLAYVGAGNPFTFTDNGTTPGTTITAISHTAGWDMAVITLSDALDSGDFDGTPSTIAAGTSKIADMAGNVIGTDAVAFGSSLSITTAVVPSTTVATVYSAGAPLVTFAAAGGGGTYSFTANAEADTTTLTNLGLVLASDGKLTGTVANFPGSYPFTIKVTDLAFVTATKGFNIGVAPAGGGGIPTISVSPAGGVQAATAFSITITGTNTNFVSGTSAVAFSFSPGGSGTNGITVGAVTVNSTTSITAPITIAADATVGARDVQVTTGTEVATMQYGFDVFASGATGLTLQAPANAGTNVQIPPAFSFNPSGDATINSYRVMVNSASNFGGTTMWDYIFPKPADVSNTNGSHCSASSCNLSYGAGNWRMISQPQPLSPNTTYYWQVRTYSEVDASVNTSTSTPVENTTVRSFTTVASVSDGTPPAIDHRPIFQAEESANLVVLARVQDNIATTATTPALATTLYYCAGASCDPITTASATSVGAGYFTYTIPSATIGVAGTIVRYYLSATDQSNTATMYQTGTTPFQLVSVTAGVGTIAGTVKDSSAACPAGIQSAKVFAEGTGFNATTNGSCVFTLTGLTAGTYDLVAIKDGYSVRSISSRFTGDTGIGFQLTSGQSGGFGGDTTSPTVRFTGPMNDMPVPGNDSNFKVFVAFSEAMSQTSITTAGNMTVNEVALSTGALTDITTTKGAWTYYAAAPSVAGIPAEANMAVWAFSGVNTFGDNKTLAVVVTPNVTDTAGNPVQGNQSDGAYVFTFTTMSTASFVDFDTAAGTFAGGGTFGAGAFTPPFAQGSTPTPGSTNVPRNTGIVINFSEPMADDVVGGYTLADNITLFTVSGTTETSVTSLAINTVTLNSAKTSATVALKSTYNSGTLAASTLYRLKVLGGAKGASSMTMGPPGSVSSVMFSADFTTGTGTDTAAPTVVGSYPNTNDTGVAVSTGAVNVAFSKDMSASTITTSTFYLSVGSTTVNGTVEYKPLDRQAYFYPKNALTANTTYTLNVTTGVQAMNGVALGTAIARTFTTGAADTVAPQIEFINGDDYGLAITFSEPMNAAKATDTLNFATSVLKVANYTIEYGAAGFTAGFDGTTITIPSTATFTYDSMGNTVMINGYNSVAAATLQGQEIYVAVTGVKDLSGNEINTDGGINTGRASILNSATTGGALGPMAMSSDAFSMGGGFMPTNFSSDTFGFAPPVDVMPFNTMAGATTIYGIGIPISTQILVSGKIVLTFPTGFDVSLAQQDVNSPMRGDLNGPGTGTVQFKCLTSVAGGKTCSGDTADANDESGDTTTKGGLADDGVVVNSSARTVTVTLSAATNVAGHDFLNIDISGIKNSTVPKDYNTSGYTVDVKTKNGTTVLESLTSMPFFIQTAGAYTLSGTITATGNTRAGTMKVYLGSPMSGSIDTTSVDFSDAVSGAVDGATQATYSFTGLSAGDYMLFTDQTVTLGTSPNTTEFTGKTFPERVLMSGNTTYDFTIGNNATGGTDITIRIDGPSGELLDIFAGSQTGFKVKQVTLDSIAGAQDFILNLANGQWFVGVGPQMPKGPMGGAPSTPSYLPPKPLDITLSGTPPNSDSVENSGTADDEILVFTLTSADKTIQGLVQDGAGKVIANAEVYAYSPQGGMGTNAQADSTGAFSLGVTDGSYIVGAFVPGMPSSKETSVIVTSHATTYLLIAGATTAITPAAAATSFILRVDKPDYTISGKVTDGTNVVSGASVYAYRTDGPGFANANTDSAGAYTLYVSNGTWNVGSFLPQYGQLTEQSVTVASANVSNQNFSPSQTGTFYSVSGRVYQDTTVVNATYDAGEALQGAFVRIKGNSTFNEAITAADGTYSFNVPAGNNYSLDADVPGVGRLAPLAAFNVAANTANKDFVVGATRTITFTFSSSVAEAFVDMFSSTGVGSHAEIKNTTAGTVSLPDGSYKVNVHIPGVKIGLGDIAATDGTTVYSSTTGIVTVADGAEGLTITIPTLRTVSGTVTDGTNNIADAWVELVNPTARVHFGTMTATNGTFSLSVVDSATDYEINAMKPGYFREPSTLTVNGANATSQTLTLSTASRSVAGQVLIGSSGAANAFIRAERQGGGFTGTQADSNGNYSLSVNSGLWHVYAVAEGYAEVAFASNPIDVTGGSVTAKNITLSSTVSLNSPMSKPMMPSSGGTLEDTTAGIKLTIPGKAMGSSTSAGNIQVKQTNNIRSTSSATPVGGKAQEIKATDSKGNPITTLVDSATVEMCYTKAELAAVASASDSAINTKDEADDLQMAYWDETTANWVTLSSTVTYKDSAGAIITDSTAIDTAAEFDTNVASVCIAAFTKHFSLYAPVVATNASAPSTPTGLAATAASASQVNLSWTLVSGATSYDLYRSTSSGGTYSRLGAEPTVSSGSTVAYSDTSGLLAGTAYYYKITALNASGESAASSAVSATTESGGGGGSYTPPVITTTPTTTETETTTEETTIEITAEETTTVETPAETVTTTTTELQLVAIPAVSATPTVSEIQAAISAILNNIQYLQAQLALLEPSTSAGAPAACAGVSFTAGLTLGSTGGNVKCLQALLNQSTDTKVAVSGVGSVGQETNYFGSLTVTAVGKFQVKKGLVSSSTDAGYGYVGPKTRAQLNTLLGK